MSEKSLLQELKDAVKRFRESKGAAELKFTDAKLNDGITVISYEGDLIDGAICMVVDTTGAKLPLPAGDYTLEDGTTFSIVDELGTVANVTVANSAPADGEDATASMTAPSATENPTVKQIVESIIKETHYSKVEVDALVAEFKTEKETFATAKKAQEDEIVAFKAKLDEQENTIKEMYELVKLMSEQPAVGATEDKPNAFKKKLSVKEISQMFKETLK